MEVSNQNTSHEAKQLSPQWVWLINCIQEQKMGFGEARVIFRHGEPVEIIELLKRSHYGSQ